MRSGRSGRSVITSSHHGRDCPNETRSDLVPESKHWISGWACSRRARSCSRVLPILNPSGPPSEIRGRSDTVDGRARGHLLEVRPYRLKGIERPIKEGRGLHSIVIILIEASIRLARRSNTIRRCLDFTIKIP